MYSLNRAEILGNMTRDPELRQTPAGKPVMTICLATNESYMDAQGQRQERSEYHNIVLWGRLAEIAAQYSKKGDRVYVEGKIQTRSWVDAQGQKRYTTEIVAQDIILLGNSKLGSGTAASGEYTPSQNSAPVQQQSEAPVIDMSDLPF